MSSKDRRRGAPSEQVSEGFRPQDLDDKGIRPKSSKRPKPPPPKGPGAGGQHSQKA